MEPAGEPTVVAAPGIAVDVASTDDGTVRWSVANDAPTAVSVDRVTLRWRVRTNGRVRVYRHGYQSWSATGTAVLGTAEDPSRTPGSIGLVRNVHHADAAIAPAGELRSELVTVLADDDGALLFGFEGGAHHDGTFRVRAVGDGLVEVDAEAYLGGAELASHSTRALHPIRVATGDPTVELERWADWAGAAASARTRTPYQVGWCSWYQYFHAVTEHDIRTNLAARTTGRSTCSSSTTASSPRSATGSTARTRFPDRSTHSRATSTPRASCPGIWIAPFIASPRSRVAQSHPDWIPHHASGRELVGLVNPGWGGAVNVLDTTNPAVLDHLEQLARTLVDMGWRYLKLDFTFAPSLAATDWHDPAQTPAERVRAGYDAIRRGAGDDTYRARLRRAARALHRCRRRDAHRTRRRAELGPARRCRGGRPATKTANPRPSTAGATR